MIFQMVMRKKDNGVIKKGGDGLINESLVGWCLETSVPSLVEEIRW